VAVEVSLDVGVSKSDLRLGPVPILLCLASYPLSLGELSLRPLPSSK
jgi:hypothetical protein